MSLFGAYNRANLSSNTVVRTDKFDPEADGLSSKLRDWKESGAIPIRAPSKSMPRSL